MTALPDENEDARFGGSDGVSVSDEDEGGGGGAGAEEDEGSGPIVAELSEEGSDAVEESSLSPAVSPLLVGLAAPPPALLPSNSSPALAPLPSPASPSAPWWSWTAALAAGGAPLGGLGQPQQSHGRSPADFDDGIVALRSDRKGSRSDVRAADQGQSSPPRRVLAPIPVRYAAPPFGSSGIVGSIADSGVRPSRGVFDPFVSPPPLSAHPDATPGGWGLGWAQQQPRRRSGSSSAPQLTERPSAAVSSVNTAAREGLGRAAGALLSTSLLARSRAAFRIALARSTAVLFYGALGCVCAVFLGTLLYAGAHLWASDPLSAAREAAVSRLRERRASFDCGLGASSPFLSAWELVPLLGGNIALAQEALAGLPPLVTSTARPGGVLAEDALFSVPRFYGANPWGCHARLTALWVTEAAVGALAQGTFAAGAAIWAVAHAAPGTLACVLALIALASAIVRSRARIAEDDALVALVFFTATSLLLADRSHYYALDRLRDEVIAGLFDSKYSARGRAAEALWPRVEGNLRADRRFYVLPRVDFDSRTVECIQFAVRNSGTTASPSVPEPN